MSYQAVLDLDVFAEPSAPPTPPDFRALHGSWRPQDIAEYHLSTGDIPCLQDQVRDLDDMLGDTALVELREGYIWVTISSDSSDFSDSSNPSDSSRFWVELAKPLSEVDFLGDGPTHETNIYQKGNEIPVYTEHTRHAEGQILSSVVMSFLEHGFPHLT